MKIEANYMNLILGFLVPNYNLTYSLTNKYPIVKITPEMVEESDDDLEGFEGYSFQCLKIDGKHKHDGQDVEYTFQITSPEGKKVKFKTEMNLVCGWNLCEDIEIK